MIMRKIVVGEFLSLDGVMQGPGDPNEDRDGGFELGGWVMQNWHDDIGGQISASMQESDTMLLGRKTWQGHAAAFAPLPEGDPFGDHMNKTPKYVVSTTLTSADWQNSTLIKSNVVEEVRQLKQQPGKNISVDGSCTLVHTLAQHGLIDEYALFVFPIVLGSGKRLFPDGVHTKMTLVESKQFPNGVMYLRYAVDNS
jgi:dihydrofolate reductase